MKKWKVFDSASWSALLSFFNRVKGAADDNASAVSDLGRDFAEFSDITTSKINGKQDKPLKGSVTIPATGWGSDGTADYPKYYDIAVTGVTASDRANVDIATASMSAAVSCGLCSTCDTLAGKIRLRAVSVPTAAMTAQYWIEKGA